MTDETFDRNSWERRWARALRESPEKLASRPPNAHLLAEIGDLRPGLALDAGCGHGSEAIWLATSGWRVTAVDFSGAGLARGQAQPGADAVTWVQADVLSWSAPPASLDLVLVAYLHVAEDDTRALLVRAVGWLRPGGRLLVLGHDVENIASGVGGPQEPAILHSVERLRPIADLLDVDRLEQVPRETPAGTALDTLLWGRRPARDAPSRR